MNKYIIGVDYKGWQAKKVFDTLLHKVSPEDIGFVTFTGGDKLNISIHSTDIEFVYKFNKQMVEVCYNSYKIDGGDYAVIVYENNNKIIAENKQINNSLFENYCEYLDANDDFDYE